MTAPSWTPDKKRDLVVVCSFAWLLFVSPVAVSLPPAVFYLLWFLLPAAYLIVRTAKNLPKIVAATACIGLLTVALDLLLLHNHAWEPYRSDFSWRIGAAPPEEILWFFLHVFYIIVWYEHFVDDERRGRARHRIGELALGGAGAMAIALCAVYWFPDAIRVRYAYAIIAALGMTPVVAYALARKSAFLKKTLAPALFFLPLAMMMEIRAVRAGLWAFSDTPNYLAIITVAGVSFPAEEIVFWMILGPVVALAYYELFADDGR